MNLSHIIKLTTKLYENLKIKYQKTKKYTKKSKKIRKKKPTDICS